MSFFIGANLHQGEYNLPFSDIIVRWVQNFDTFEISKKKTGSYFFTLTLLKSNKKMNPDLSSNSDPHLDLDSNLAPEIPKLHCMSTHCKINSYSDHRTILIPVSSSACIR